LSAPVAVAAAEAPPCGPVAVVGASVEAPATEDSSMSEVCLTWT